MTKRIVVIDGEPTTDMHLSIAGGTLTVAVGQERVQVVLADVGGMRLHFEVETTADLVVVGNPEHPEVAGLPLHPGESVDVGSLRLVLQAPTDGELPLDDLPGIADEAGPTPVADPSPATPPPPTGQRYQLKVTDGADQGRAYLLPEIGKVLLGKSDKYADIVLHDLYVARVHCSLEVQADAFLVTHNEGQNGTLINGQQIKQPEQLRPGDVLRIGNSHMHLEPTVLEDHPATPRVPEVETIGVLDEVAEVESLEIIDDDAASTKRNSVASAEVEAELDAPAPTPGPRVDELYHLKGQVLGHYRLGPVLGRSPAGLVFKAQDLKSQGIVAVKVLAPDFPASVPELELFVRTLKAATQLPHANLITLHGAGKSGPFCWIAREYVEGESLAARIDRHGEDKSPNWHAALRLIVHLARALDFLHQHKVVHGNIIPANIVIRASDEQAKLTNLMFIQAVENSGLHLAMLEEKLLADMPYLAPEQTDPDAFVDQLADLYALGAMAYALLTGRPPCTGASPEDVLAAVRDGKIMKPSKLQASIPAAFDAIVMKLLAKNQEDRYPSAATVLADLKPLVRQHALKV